VYHAPGRGRPDFVPVRELNKVDGIWYHLDDIDYLTASTDPPTDPKIPPYIPYSYSPPAEGETPSYTGFASKKEVIQSALVNSIPYPPIPESC
jgi:hypothetical protein